MIFELKKDSLDFQTAEPELLRLSTSLWIECNDSEQALSLLRRLPRDGLAVVGTREPSLNVVRWLKSELTRLRASPLVILSGLARGIDSAAHEAALEVGLPTIGFIACGHDQAYPPDTQRLREEILNAGGLIISEYALGTPAYKSQFLARNRWIAAFARAVLVAQAGRRSGALNTARWAQDLDRDLYVVPSFPGAYGLEGNQALLESCAAHSFWGAQSLATTWSGLRCAPLGSSFNEATHRDVKKADPNEQELLAHWRAASGDQEAVEVHGLCTFCESRGMDPLVFYRALRGCLSSGLLIDQNGLILKNLPVQI